MKFIPFITAGFPTESLFKKILFLLQEEGAEMIEVGVPYSDPLADGPVIQQSSLRAIDQGMNLERTLELVSEVRKEGLQVPLVLFTYYNPLLQMGLDRLARRLSESGFNGILVPDLPLEENGALKEALQPYKIPIISLIAPTSKGRIRQIAEQAEGFIYIVSSLGVTGERSTFHQEIATLINEVKNVAKVPIVLGFGIKEKSQLEPLAENLDGFVIGSALIRAITEIEQRLLTRENILQDEAISKQFEKQLIEELRLYLREVLQ